MTKIEQAEQKLAVGAAYRILVLDGQSGHMQEIKDACKNLGQEVVPVTSIAEGLHFLDTKNHVDVVVAEAFLEQESVFEFLKSLKEDPQHKDIPVMIMAAEPSAIGQYCLNSVESAAEILGAYKFLYMPKFDIRRLMREVRAILPEDHAPKKDTDPDGAY